MGHSQDDAVYKLPQNENALAETAKKIVLKSTLELDVNR